MDKIVVDVFAPVIDKTYDFILPCHMKISELGNLINKAIAEHENLPIDFEDAIIFFTDSGEVLDEELDISQTKVKDGSRLTIV